MVGRTHTDRLSYTSRVNPLTLFGAVAVTAMLVFYALEERAPAFILGFAAACAMSSVYGFLQGAWPFGIVEAIWTGVAIRRWWRRRRGARRRRDRREGPRRLPWQ